MSINTYALLKSAIADRLRRADTAAYVDDWVTLAETDIYRRLRTKDMEAALSGTISGGLLALPTGYIDLKFAYINTTPVTRLRRKMASWIYENYSVRSATGKPCFIAREGSNFIFGPYPDSNYTVSGVYFKNLGEVSTTAHVLFTNNPDVYLYGSLYVAAKELKDRAGEDRWGPLYERCLMQAQKASDAEETSGGGLEMTPG